MLLVCDGYVVRCWFCFDSSNGRSACGSGSPVNEIIASLWLDSGFVVTLDLWW